MKSKSSLSSSTTETQISIPGDTTEEEYRTMLNRSIREFNKTYGPKTKAAKKKELKKAEKQKDKNSYEELLAKIERDERTVRMLEKENAILKAQIQACESKIKAYPKVKKRYDELTGNIERAHSLEIAPKKR